MRRFGESESKYLRSTDLMVQGSNPPTYRRADVTIERVAVETLTRENESDDHKYILYFAGKQKGMVLNVTNEEWMTATFGVPPGNDPATLSAHFAGASVTIYVDPNIKFGGKRVGGLRLMARATPEAAPSPPMQTPEEEPPAAEDEWADPATEPGSDEIPF